MADIADDGLPPGVDVHMLDRYVLLTLSPFPHQGFDLHGVGAHEFSCQVAEHVQPFDAITLVQPPSLCALVAASGMLSSSSGHTLRERVFAWVTEIAKSFPHTSHKATPATSLALAAFFYVRSTRFGGRGDLR